MVSLRTMGGIFIYCTNNRFVVTRGHPRTVRKSSKIRTHYYKTVNSLKYNMRAACSAVLFRRPATMAWKFKIVIFFISCSFSHSAY